MQGRASARYHASGCRATGVEAGDAASLRRAVRGLFEHFTGRGARACAISLPPDFAPAGPAPWDAPAAVFSIELATRSVASH